MCKNYTENDKIEFRLVHCADNVYDLEWRFKELHKYLFFYVSDSWKILNLYQDGIASPDEDPSDESFWRCVSFDFKHEEDVREYERLIEAVKTKRELYDYYGVDAYLQRFKDDLRVHQMWADKTQGHINKLLNL
jgi:hypothetical protein